MELELPNAPAAAPALAPSPATIDGSSEASRGPPLATTSTRAEPGQSTRKLVPPWRRWRWWLASVIAAAAAIAAVLTVRLAPNAPTLPRVAAATFVNASGEPGLDAVAVVITDYLADGLSRVDSVIVVSRSAVLAVEREAGARGRVVGRGVRASVVMTGTLHAASDNTVVVRTRLVDEETGEVLVALADVRVPRDDPTRGLEELRQRVAGGVAMLTMPIFGRGMLPVGDPPKIDALLAVRDGLELQAGIRQLQPGMETLAELTVFDRAVAADPQFLQARLWFVSAALRRFGGEAMADSVLRIVEGQREQLSEWERSVMDALRADVTGNHERSVQGWQKAVARAPSWPSRWWLAQKLRDANRPRAALALFDSLGSGHRELWRATPGLLHVLGEHRAERAALARETAAAPSLENTLDYQDALLQSLAALDSVTAIHTRVSTLLSMPREGGTSVAFLLTRAAWELHAHGHPADADSVLRQAASWCTDRSAADLADESVRFDCLEAYTYANSFNRVLGSLRDDLSKNPQDVVLWGLLGVAAARSANRPLADSAANRIARETPSGGSRGLGSWLRARIAAASGRQDEAITLLRDAFARGAGWTMRMDLHRDPAFDRLRRMPAFEVLRRPAD